MGACRSGCGLGEAAYAQGRGAARVCETVLIFRCAVSRFIDEAVNDTEGELMVALFELGARRAADALRNGEHTAEALAEALLARCAASPLNAFITLEAERLRAAARAADQRRQRGERLGPLHGVPLALKDNIDTADFPTTGGTPALAAHRPKRNAPIVQRLLDAGAIVLGKTNLQELAYGPTNNNAAFGPARNPYDPMRIPGGSSGGSAAAVAARLAPAALGTDTGGSIRVPASLCGITSMRPTTLRWLQAGIVPLSHTRDTAGPMARHVADCVLLDGVITGGPTEVTPAPLKGLRLGLPRDYFRENLDAELAAILEAALARLREAGVVLVEGDVANVAALDAAAGFPIMLYETVIELERYLAEHETGLNFASLMAQVKSPPRSSKRSRACAAQTRCPKPPIARRSPNIARRCRRRTAAISGSAASPRWCSRQRRCRPQRSERMTRSCSTACRCRLYPPLSATSPPAAPRASPALVCPPA